MELFPLKFFKGFGIALMLTIFSCSRDAVIFPLRDDRDAYVGKYAVHQTNNCYGPCDTCHSEEDLILVVDYGNTDSIVIFQNREIPISVIESYYAYHYNLRIKNDSLHTWNMSGGLGCGVYIVQDGVRIDKNLK